MATTLDGELALGHSEGQDCKGNIYGGLGGETTGRLRQSLLLRPVSGLLQAVGGAARVGDLRWQRKL